MRENFENCGSGGGVYREKQFRVKVSRSDTDTPTRTFAGGLTKSHVFGMLSVSFETIFREDGDIVHGDSICFCYIHEILC